MFAFRLSAKKSLAYFAFYAPFLLAFNVLRVAFTIAVGISYGEAAMDAVHMALWVFDSLLVLCLWTRAAGISFGAKKVAFAS
jgi:exosortase/archaeosortase family protein